MHQRRQADKSLSHKSDIVQQRLLVLVVLLLLPMLLLTGAARARQQPQRRMLASANVRQQFQLGANRARRPIAVARRAAAGALLDDRLDGGLIVHDRVHLVDHDGDDEQSEQRRLEQQQDAVQPVNRNVKNRTTPTNPIATTHILVCAPGTSGPHVSHGYSHVPTTKLAE